MEYKNSCLGIHAAVVLTLSLMTVGCRSDREPAGAEAEALTGDLIVFHAGSLSVPLRAVSERFRQVHPGISIKAEAAGSRDTARKVSDLGRPCDVLASADYRVVEELLMPDHADFNIRFAGNEMVLAYTARSKFAERISDRNWPEILVRPDVAIGRADPERDPCGYRTEMLFQLAEKHCVVPGLAARLLAKDRRYIRPKETDLLALLESGEIDYLFIYRSVVEQHKLEMVRLPVEVNLGSPAHARDYGEAMVQLRGRSPGESVLHKGEAIVYSVTIPRGAPNLRAADAYVAFLLSPEGQAILKASGHQPICPAVVDHFEKLPKTIRSLCQPEPSP